MTMTEIDQPRASERVPYAARLLVVRGDKAWFAAAHDLSEGGCGVFRPDDCDLEADQLVQLCFHVADNALAVTVPARVAQVGESQIGFEYHDLQSVPPTRQPR